MRLILGTLLALPILGRAIAVEPRVATTTSFPGHWITIDAAGNVATVTPSLNTAHSSTVSPPPSALTQPATYVLSLNGHATTTTASPPVASATGPGTAGAFMACFSSQDATTDLSAPFCQPRPGTQLTPNRTYFVTWDPSGFDANQTVELQAKLSGGGLTTAPGIGEYEGFTTAPLKAASGFYAWTIDGSFVTANGGSTTTGVNVTFSLAYNQSTIPDPNGTTKLLVTNGPSVLVTNNPALPSAKRRHHVAAVAIAVPVVIGAAVLALLSSCVWSYRHHGHLPCIGGLVSRRTSSFSAKGYGVRQSYGQRAGGVGGGGAGTYGPGLRGGSTFSPPPYEHGSSGVSENAGGSVSSPRGNVFREELKRQEDERRG